MLRFYSQVNPMGSCQAQSVYLTTLLLGRLSPQFKSINQYHAHYTDNCPSWISRRERINDPRKYFMNNLHEWMLQATRGVKPTTSWSPVRHASNWATQASIQIVKMPPKNSNFWIVARKLNYENIFKILFFLSQKHTYIILTPFNPTFIK